MRERHETAKHRPAALRLAAVTWLVAGLMWLVLEAISAAGYPGYSYARNYISDLGVPPAGAVQGRMIGSPRHALMNVNFIAHGILFLLAGLWLFRAVGAGRSRRVFLTLAIIYALGSALVGIFHGSAQADAEGTSGLHFLGAALAIVGGNAALIVAGTTARRLGVPDSYRNASVIIGLLGLASIITLQAANPFALTGLWERGGVYSITFWEIGTGVAILIAGRHRARVPANDADLKIGQPSK